MGFSPVKVIGIIVVILIIAGGVFSAFSGLLPAGGARANDSVLRDSGILLACTANLTLCSGRCVDLRTDAGNCGACGFSVPYGQSCRNGTFSPSPAPGAGGPSPAPTTTPTVSATATATTAATSCRPGLKLCSGTCRDLQSDSRNCGSCGYVCPAGLTCQNAWCLEPGGKSGGSSAAPVTLSASSCEHGETLCGNTCADLFSDKKNCGVCGRACGAREICVNARCGPACTTSGTTLCGDTCVDLDTDMSNCGACGTECETYLPNAQGSLCTGGECVISACKTDYDDCDGKVENGCEVNLRLSANNCGSCGNSCSSGQVCYAGQCRNPAGT
jgi:hypothetical protein